MGLKEVGGSREEGKREGREGRRETRGKERKRETEDWEEERLRKGIVHTHEWLAEDVSRGNRI